MSRLIDGPIEVNMDAVLENGGEFSDDEPVELPIDVNAFLHVGAMVLTLGLLALGFCFGFAG